MVDPLARAAAPLRGLYTLSQQLRSLLDWLGAAIGWLVLAMALLTAVVVVLRYFFHIGSIALQESVTYLHAAVFMLGAAYAAQRDEHVRVDIFYRHFSRRSQVVVNLIGTLVFLLPVMALLFFFSLDYVTASWALGERSSDSGGLAFRYLLKTLLLLLPLLMLVHAVVLLIESLLELTGWQPVPSSAHEGML
jgi:TRAP-type mannitol/chloroaromatic compound transport system permease small subunit